MKIISYTFSDNTAVNCKDEWTMMMMDVDPTSFIISKHVIWMNANDVHNDTKIHNLKNKSKRHLSLDITWDKDNGQQMHIEYQ